MTGNNQISDDEKRYTGDNSKMKTLIVYYSMEGNTEYAADVREKDEYSSGRIPGAVNIPLSVIDRFNLSISRDTPIFLYCLRGSRSRRAMGILKKRGYSNVKSIGGISGYKGKIEK